jgi:hypothetical protein
VADGDGADATLGLRRLARIVDDEGIDDRQACLQHLWPALIGKRHRLARQPFQSPMRPDMDHRVKTLRLEPKVKGDIGMARVAREVVIITIARGPFASFGLQGHHRMAKVDRRKAKGPVDNGGVILGRAPAIMDSLLQRRGQIGQGPPIFREPPRQRLSLQRHGQIMPRRDAISRLCHVGQNGLRRGERIEPHRMGHRLGPPRIGG